MSQNVPMAVHIHVFDLRRDRLVDRRVWTAGFPLYAVVLPMICVLAIFVFCHYMLLMAWQVGAGYTSLRETQREWIDCWNSEFHDKIAIIELGVGYICRWEFFSAAKYGDMRQEVLLSQYYRVHCCDLIVLITLEWQFLYVHLCPHPCCCSKLLDDVKAVWEELKSASSNKGRWHPCSFCTIVILVFQYAFSYDDIHVVLLPIMKASKCFISSSENVNSSYVFLWALSFGSCGVY